MTRTGAFAGHCRREQAVAMWTVNIPGVGIVGISLGFVVVVSGIVLLVLAARRLRRG